MVYVESKEPSKQTTLKQTHRHRKHTDGPQGGRWLGDWVIRGKELRTTNWKLQNSHRKVKYSTGNIGNNTVITMYDATWVLEISGRTFYKICD